MIESIRKNNRGMAALLSVVIVSAVILIMAKSSAESSRADLDATNDSLQSSLATSNAESCLSEAIAQIRNNRDFTSAGMGLGLGDGDCNLEVRRENEFYIVSTEGHVADYVKGIEAKLLAGSSTIEIISKMFR